MTKHKLYAIFMCFTLVCLCLTQAWAGDLYDTLLNDMKAQLTDDDIGRIFILNCEFPAKNGPTFQPGTRMVLQGISDNGCLVCYPAGVPGKKTFRFKKQKLLPTPFFEDSPALAYSQLVLEIFAAPDFYQSNPLSARPTTDRQTVNAHIALFLDAIPTSNNGLDRRIEIIGKMMMKAKTIKTNLLDDYNNETAEQKELARQSRISAEEDEDDDGGCLACPMKNKTAKRSGRSMSLWGKSRKRTGPVISPNLSPKEKMRIVQDHLGIFYKDTETKISEAISSQDLTLAMVIYVNARHFTETVLKRYGLGKKLEQLDDWKNLEEDFFNRIKPFFQDENCRDNVNDFTKLFPDTTLLFNEQTPSTYRSCASMLDRSFQAYVGIYEHSPEADFANWGRCNLDFFLFAGGAPFTSDLMRDYFDELRNYKLNLKANQQQTEDSNKQKNEKDTSTDMETNQ